MPLSFLAGKAVRRFALCVVVLLTTGCAGGIGPAKLAPTRMDYNLAIQKSNNEEMLLNLVRMKYFEQPLFLQVGSVASSFNYNVSGGLSATIPDHRSLANGVYTTYDPSISAQYSDSPTVTYTAYQGQAYAQQFLAELDFDRFVVLYKGGWDIEFLMRILFMRFGRIDHTYDARAGFHPEQHERFEELVGIVARMDDRGGLDVVKVSIGENNSATIMSMVFKHEAEAMRVQELLGYNIGITVNAEGRAHARFKLTALNELDESLRFWKGLPVVPLRLRNCLRAMDIVAQGIEVPYELTQRKRGFDLREQFVSLCDIRVASSEPANAYVAIRHQEHWYYIRSDDARSKEIFQLILNIFSLQSADPPKTNPVLTLSVGGN